MSILSNMKTLGDLGREKPQTNWAIYGLIKIPSVGIVFGDPGAHKSNLAMDAGACMVLGRVWLEGQSGNPFETQKLRVMWLDFDNGEMEVEPRLAAFKRHYGLMDNDPFFYVSMDPYYLDMSKPQSVLELEEAIEHFHPDVVFVDNLSVVSGELDENSNGMGRVLGAFRALANKHCCAFVIIHHKTKGTNGGTYTKGDQLRGHGSIRGALDFTFMVSRREKSNKVDIYPAKVRGCDVEEFSAYYNYKHFEGTKDLQECWFSGQDIDNATSRVKTAVIAFLKTGSHNQTKIVEHCKGLMHKDGVCGILRELVETGEIICTSGKTKNALIYSLPPDKLILPRNLDIVRYDHEIIPTSGISGLNEIPTRERGAE